jgi:hypothetical protein
MKNKPQLLSLINDFNAAVVDRKEETVQKMYNHITSFVNSFLALELNLFPDECSFFLISLMANKQTALGFIEAEFGSEKQLNQENFSLWLTEISDQITLEASKRLSPVFCAATKEPQEKSSNPIEKANIHTVPGFGKHPNNIFLEKNAKKEIPYGLINNSCSVEQETFTPKSKL